jgi:hypothetical protein
MFNRTSRKIKSEVVRGSILKANLIGHMASHRCLGGNGAARANLFRDCLNWPIRRGRAQGVSSGDTMINSMRCASVTSNARYRYVHRAVADLADRPVGPAEICDLAINPDIPQVIVMDIHGQGLAVKVHTASYTPIRCADQLFRFGARAYKVRPVITSVFT